MLRVVRWMKYSRRPIAEGRCRSSMATASGSGGSGGLLASGSESGLRAIDVGS